MFGEHQKAAYLLDIDLGSGRSRIVLSEKDEPRVELNTTPYAPVAVDVIGNMEEVIWYSHRSGWGHLYRYDARTGRMPNDITQGDWLVRALIDVEAHRGLVVLNESGRG